MEAFGEAVEADRPAGAAPRVILPAGAARAERQIGMFFVAGPGRFFRSFEGGVVIETGVSKVE
ncbi:hypothetical protein GCM10023191_023450 [Actinoallomurus oryzae]|uniref:Uncharacterized protein n=1 Tax=Actinoallomurus oryzae TaxID=502180 RepID=A0ABP8PQX1_9ACTN